jgi:molybdenum cofactor cytidylyltransferase
VVNASRSSVAAIVLAAGMSRRMGKPKQLLRAGERTLLEHTLESVRHSSAGETILVLGFAAEEIRQQISTEGFKVVVNAAYAEGMGSSLRAGISALGPQIEAVLIVLADQPFVRPATLDRLIEHHQKFRPQILIPTYNGFRGNPVLLDRSVFPEVANLRGDIGCRAIFGNHTEGIAKLEVDDIGILLDVDTQGDWEQLISAVRGTEGASALAPPAELESRSPGEPAASDRPELLVVGEDAVALALVKLARVLGFTTTIVDPLLSLSDLPEADRILHVLDFSRLPENRNRYVVVASRSRFDEDALEQAFASGAVYVGLLANQKRSQELRESLIRKGVSADRLAQMRAPAGVEIGAERPEEIALSIMAEIVAERHRATRTANVHLQGNQV